MSTITIEKQYFETILRKANFHQLQESTQESIETDNVLVSKVDYDKLLGIAREYESLKLALLRGGITHETLQLLINDNVDGLDGNDNGDVTAAVDAEHISRRPKAPVSIRDPVSGEIKTAFTDIANGDVHVMSNGHSSRNSHGGRHEFTYGRPSGGDDGAPEEPRKYDLMGRPILEKRIGNRTLLFSKLPDRVSFGRILDVVRGGLLVDIYMLNSPPGAAISFYETSNAEAYLAYAQKNDIFIDGKKVQVEWREPNRQYTVYPNIVGAVQGGATRNLVLRRAPHDLSDKRLRDDLDHIQNLNVEKIRIANGNAYVNLNSIAVAMFARTCLKSRAYYRGVKIDFAPDDCSKPLATISGRRPSTQSSQQNNKRENLIPINRFQALAIDDTVDGSSDGDPDTASGVNLSWADTITNDRR